MALSPYSTSRANSVPVKPVLVTEVHLIPNNMTITTIIMKKGVSNLVIHLLIANK